MLYVLLLLVALVVSVGFWLAFMGGQLPSSSAEAPPLRYARRELMTPTELGFYGLLRTAFPALQVAPQVAISALVDAAKTPNDPSAAHRVRGKVSQKRLDFVVFEPATARVVCVIELDDHTHDRAARAQSDRERDAILTSVGLRVLRFDARAIPSAEALKAAVLQQA